MAEGVLLTGELPELWLKSIPSSRCSIAGSKLQEQVDASRMNIIPLTNLIKNSTLSKNA